MRISLGIGTPMQAASMLSQLTAGHIRVDMLGAAKRPSIRLGGFRNWLVVHHPAPVIKAHLAGAWADLVAQALDECKLPMLIYMEHPQAWRCLFSTEFLEPKLNIDLHRLAATVCASPHAWWAYGQKAEAIDLGVQACA